ncbi:DUF4870 domain-containing protein [Herbiconiux sp. A18JL235]|uniref:DUF4870 domain-containing protein n=1 Tax=Herbiconiux sp. A18JL235 TaxID=3152363 RepID=A0AB39BG55_9MICO
MTTATPLTAQDEKTWIPLVLYTLGGVLAFVLVGFALLFLAPLVQLAGVVLAIVAGVKAGQAGTFRYPFVLRFLK